MHIARCGMTARQMGGAGQSEGHWRTSARHMGGAGQSEGHWRTLELGAGVGRLHVRTYVQLGTCAAIRSSFAIETSCSKVHVEHVVVVEYPYQKCTTVTLM